MVLHDASRPYDPRIFERGHPGRPGESIPRQFVRIASARRTPFGGGSGRLDLAREILSKDNPLTARVFVNRVWMHHFGRGLVGTPGDFGLRGDAPTHPELLDWLASEWANPDRQGGGGPHPVAHASGSPKPWSIKRLHKLIMTSEAYKQASLDRGDALAVDPDNRLLWKQNRRRLEFEPLHDAMLAVSGQLDLKLGGPAVKLFGGDKRRAVYGYVDRLEFPSLLTTFDVPNPAGLTPERTNTTVAPQALFLMNGPFARDAAKKLIAHPSVQELTDPGERRERLYLILLGRQPDEEERKLAVAFISRGRDHWVNFAHGLLMTNEFAFVD
jgi:hypothetical protein